MILLTMGSRSLARWRTIGSRALDEIESAHSAIGGQGPGRRYATQQINQAYAVLLSSQFQKYCRDVHSEATDYLVPAIVAPLHRALFRTQFMRDRKLEIGNPNPGNLGSDFARFGMDLWELVYAHDPRNKRRRERLEEWNAWRNAIAHQNFRSPSLQGKSTLRLSDVREWRAACDALAKELDYAVARHLAIICGTAPW